MDNKHIGSLTIKLEDPLCVSRISFKGLENCRSTKNQPVPTDDVPEVEEPYYAIEKLLRWCKVKRGRKFSKEYSVLWKAYPIEEVSWIQASQFSHPIQLEHYQQEDQPQEEKV